MQFEEQGGISKEAEDIHPADNQDYNVFNNFDQNISEYQIEKDNSKGTIRIQIGTVYNNRQSAKFSAALRRSDSPGLSPGLKKTNSEVSPLIQIEEVFGRKYNFEITIDPKQKSGLKGLPSHLEDQLLGLFTKQEIMDDPDKVIQCIIESKMTD